AENRAGDPRVGDPAFVLAPGELIGMDQAPRRGVEIFRVEQRLELAFARGQVSGRAERWRRQLHQVPGMPQRILDTAQAPPGDQLDSRKPQTGLERLNLVRHALASSPRRRALAAPPRIAAARYR